jgi:hypothetical protein
MNQPVEKRKWTRVERRFRISAIVIDPEKSEDLFKLDPVWTRDVGGNGLGLVTRVHCMVGAAIDLHFQLPGQAEPIHAKGRVVWSKLEDGSDDEYRVGIAFDRIREPDRQAIMRYVESEAKKRTAS